MLPAAPSRPPRFYALLLVALFAYLLYARLHEANTTFLLLRDQMRDWTIALDPFRSLPLTGPQSTAGGASLGPVYYWVLWAARCVIGPWVHNLPVAGALGIDLMQGAADLFLLDTLRRRTGSTAVALAAVLFGASAPHELAVSSTIWNPAVAVAFVKLAIALRLRHGADASLWWTGVATASAWFAVQSHSAAIFVAAPICASYVLLDVLSGRVRRAAEQTRVIVEVILLLQIPFLVGAMTKAGELAPTRALGGASDILASGAIRWQASLHALSFFLVQILFAPWAASLWTSVLGLSVIVLALRARRDLPLLAVTVLPLATTLVGLGLWQGNYDGYWYLAVAPCATLTLVLAATSWRPRTIGLVLLVAILAAQPARVRESDWAYRMPQYGPVLRGTQHILRQTTSVRRLTTSFEMPAFSDETYLFKVMGGRLSDDAEFDAVIDAEGGVRFTSVPR